MTQLRSFSFGGGTQSMAALVLAAQGEIDYRLFMFANVGEDTEFPGTLDYMREHAVPFAAEHGLELIELRRNSKYRSLLDKIRRLESSLAIPVRMDRTGAPGRRSCTTDWKIKVVAKELRRRGATVDTPAVVGLGITMDEWQRVRSEIDPTNPEQRRRYPLIELDLTRQDCQRIIADAGLPVPPRSACWFCPFHTGEEWQRLKRSSPELFEKACGLEELLQERRAKLGRDPVWMSGQGARERTTLRVLYSNEQLQLDSGDDAACDGGFCMT